MKRPTQSPTWMPLTLHLAHGLIAGGVGYMLAYSAVIYTYAEPGSARSNVAIFAAVGLGLFEVAFFVYLVLRRRRLRKLWAEAAKLLRRDEFEAARGTLIELLGYAEYKLAPQPVLFALGSCTEAMGNQREAMVLYRRCGDFAPALRAIGMLQLERGLNDSAAEALRKLVARRPQDTFSVVLLSLALFRMGSHDVSARVLRRGLEKRPKSEMLRVNLSRVERGAEPGFDLNGES